MPIGTNLGHMKQKMILYWRHYCQSFQVVFFEFLSLKNPGTPSCEVWGYFMLNPPEYDQIYAQELFLP